MDAPASLPLVELLTLVMSTKPRQASPRELFLLRAFRLFRLVRLLKIFKMGEALRSVEAATGMDLRGLQVVACSPPQNSIHASSTPPNSIPPAPPLPP